MELLEFLDERLGVATFKEAEAALGPARLLSELEALPDGEVEVVSILPFDILCGCEALFLQRRGAELGCWF